ncbi:phospholipase A2-like [Anoplolepis gracilipes]|uniref:phospholipase A2-like n=1 Tax=Anoplolepis gracilipes TaxID=354296 RepID=UPI003BA04262
MSHIYLFIFFLGITVRFGDCGNNGLYGDDIDCTTESTPGSEKTHLSFPERTAKRLRLPFDYLENLIRGKKKMAQIISYNSEESSEEVNIYTFPGTVWCGDGDNAKDENDLGRFKHTDTCCRVHDNCNSNILVGETKGNLKNNGLFTRSACTCDNAFFDCLKNVSSPISKGIGTTYFDILRPQCFECICPTADCQIGNVTDCNNQCTKYRWVDSRKF